jgi:hypothetical protein
MDPEARCPGLARFRAWVDVLILLAADRMNKELFGTIRGWMYVVGVAMIAGAFWLRHHQRF